MASAEPTPAPAPGCKACATASPRSTARSRSRAGPVAAHGSAQSSRAATSPPPRPSRPPPQRPHPAVLVCRFAASGMGHENAPVVFISHTTRDNRDSRLAHRLAQGLKERGAGAWIAPEDIPAGNEWQEDLVAGVMGRSTHFLVVLSAASTRAHWVLDEIRLARERYEQHEDIRILPLPVGKLGKYANSDFLGTLQQ